MCNQYNNNFKPRVKFKEHLGKHIDLPQCKHQRTGALGRWQVAGVMGPGHRAGGRVGGGRGGVTSTTGGSIVGISSSVNVCRDTGAGVMDVSF